MKSNYANIIGSVSELKQRRQSELRQTKYVVMSTPIYLRLKREMQLFTVGDLPVEEVVSFLGMEVVVLDQDEPFVTIG